MKNLKKSLNPLLYLIIFIIQFNKVQAQNPTAFPLCPYNGIQTILQGASSPYSQNIYTVDIGTGVFTTLSTGVSTYPVPPNPASQSLNGIGYNIKDNFVYGVTSAPISGSAGSYKFDCFQLGANGQVKSMGLTDASNLLVNGNLLNVGDVNSDGNLVVGASNRNQLFLIQLPGSTTPLTSVSTPTVVQAFNIMYNGTQVILGASDVAFPPNSTTDLYFSRDLQITDINSNATSQRLGKITLNYTSSIATYTDLGLDGLPWANQDLTGATNQYIYSWSVGACYFDNKGNLYLGQNFGYGTATAPQGALYKMTNTTGNPATINFNLTPQFLAYQPATNRNDGARCPLAPPITDWPPQVNPDINVTFLNMTVNGNTHTNDSVPSGTTYSTSPVAIGVNPNSNLPTMNSDGTYTFISSTVGVYNFNVPVCIPPTNFNCVNSLLRITVLDTLKNNNYPVVNTDITMTIMNTAVKLITVANDHSGNRSTGAINPTTVTIVTNPNHGAANVNTSTGDITYTPATGFIGNDTIKYQVCDVQTSAKCASAYQIITVLDVGLNPALIGSDDYNTALNYAPSTGFVKTNDTDPQNNSISYVPQNVTVTGKGTFVLSNTGAYTFTPAPGFSGPINFPYRICDNGTPQPCVNATLYFTVLQPSTLAISGESVNIFSKGSSAIINWTTINDVNVSHFEIYRKNLDGVNFTKIGNIISNGNNNFNNTYSFKDENLTNGTYLYYIKTVSKDLTTKNSNTYSIKINNNINSINVFPNPTSKDITISFFEFANTKNNIKLIDATGKILYTNDIILSLNNYTKTIPMNSLSKGIYNLIIKSEKGVSVFKVVKN